MEFDEKAQRDRINEWNLPPMCVDGAAKQVIEQQVKALYKAVDAPEPEITWVLSIPAACNYIVTKYLDKEPNRYDLDEVYHMACASSHDRIELATLELYANVLVTVPNTDIRTTDRRYFRGNWVDVIYPFLNLARHLDLWWALRKEVVLAIGPEFIHRDRLGRLHCENGPAIRYLDGIEIYALENCNLPKHVVCDPSKITVAEIKDLTNVEARRLYIQRMGVKRFLKETGSQQLDEDGGLNTVGGAPRALLQDCYGDRYLYCTDGSTSRTYFLAVPRIAKTCKEAHQMISGLTDENCLIAEC